MELLSVIRRWAFRDRLLIQEISRRTSVLQNTIRKYLRLDVVEPVFKVPDRSSKLDAYADKLSAWLKVEGSRPRNHPLGACAKAANTKRSRVRARAENVVGHMATAMGATLVRTIGLGRAKAKIGTVNLAYNMSRHATLYRMAASSP